MKRKDYKNEENDPFESKSTQPQIDELLDTYRASAYSNSTFATQGTRGSTLMPQSPVNLGLPSNMNEDMTEEEVQYFYGLTEFAKKIKNATGNSVLPPALSRAINEEAKQELKRAKKEKREKTLQKRKKLAKLILVLAVVIALIFGIVFGILNR